MVVAAHDAGHGVDHPEVDFDVGEAGGEEPVGLQPDSAAFYKLDHQLDIGGVEARKYPASLVRPTA